MSPSDAVPDPETMPLSDAATAAALAEQAHRVGSWLLWVAAGGGILGLLAGSPLGVLMAVACAAAGAHLVRLSGRPSAADVAWVGAAAGGRVVGQVVDGVAAVDGRPVYRLVAAGGSAVGAVCGRLTEAVVELVRGVLRAVACGAAGLGVALIVVGLFALNQPGPWDYDLLRRVGPPVAPVALGAGVGLLTAQGLFVLLSVRSRRPARKSPDPA